MGRRLPGSTSPIWVACGAALAGVATYVLLVVTARALGPSGYGEFSLFWSAIVVVSLGAFLPVEQVLARRGAGAGEGSLLRRGVRLSSSFGLIATVLCCALWIAQGERLGASGVVALTVAFATAALGFVLQFPARGTLAAEHRLRGYSVVIVVDAVLRAGMVVVLWLTGVTAVWAYAAAVAISSLVCGVVGILILWRSRATDVRPRDVEMLVRPALWPEVSRLVVAMLSMQVLLNSGVIVAGLTGPGEGAAAAGELLAVITLARLPVFVTQAAQATYVSRIASSARAKDYKAVVGLVRLIGLVVGALALLTVLAAAVAGPQVVALVFGADYDVSWTSGVLVAAGIGAYLVASVSNDVAVALGAHRRLAVAWLVGLVVAAVIVLVLDDLVLRSTLPLLVGSLIAASLLVPGVIGRIRRLDPR